MKHFRPEGAPGVYTLVAESSAEWAMLKNATRFYDALAGKGVAPKVYVKGLEDHIGLEDIPGAFDHDQPGLPELDFLWGCVDLLKAFQEHGIVHGDLTRKNILVRDNRPLACDFQESCFEWETTPADHRPEGDAYWLWRAAAEITGDRDRRFRRWLAIRDVLEGDVLDLGCGPGHFTVMAALEGHDAIGIDNDHQALKVAWRHRIERASFQQDDFSRFWVKELPDVGTVLFLSTWAHFGQRHSWGSANEFLKSLVRRYPQVIFETQIKGDGPGLQETQGYLRDYLERFCTAKPLIGLPVWGRRAYRIVWRLTA